MGDYDEFSFPLIFQHKNKHKPLDMLDTGSGCLYLISDRMRKILEENQLTGWNVFSIKLLEKNNEIPGYHGFSVLGRCGQIDYSKSEIIYKQMFEWSPLKKHYKGEHFDLDQWDGSDFFVPKGTSETIVTSKVADVLEKNKITNLRLTPLSDVEISESSLKILGLI